MFRQTGKSGFRGRNKMFIREYQSSDCKELAELFYNTVHAVNVKDYTKEQVDVWATGDFSYEFCYDKGKINSGF